MSEEYGDEPSREEQLAALHKIDALSEDLQKEGKLLESLHCMEKSLILRGHSFGLDSQEVFKACKSVGEMCNFLAMTYLQEDEFDITLELLKKAEVLTERHRVVRAITYNNLGCYYRKRGKLRTALSYIRKALTLEASMSHSAKSYFLPRFVLTPSLSSYCPISISRADTHLNMCTILSEVGRHDKALQHARTALKLLLLELFGPHSAAAQQQETQVVEHEGDQVEKPKEETKAGDGKQESGEEAKEGEEGDGKEEEGAALPPDRVAVLAIAYHNLAVQQEFLRKYKGSLSSYEKACKVMTTHLGEDHPLVKSLTDSYNEAKEKLAGRIARQDQIAAKSNRKFVKTSSAPSGYDYEALGKGGKRGASRQPLTHQELALLSSVKFEGSDEEDEGESEEEHEAL
jgi:tetratricopeptide (TPR) repeat protein